MADEIEILDLPFWTTREGFVWVDELGNPWRVCA
jgi:hypothetical protein